MCATHVGAAFFRHPSATCRWGAGSWCHVQGSKERPPPPNRLFYVGKGDEPPAKYHSRDSGIFEEAHKAEHTNARRAHNSGLFVTSVTKGRGRILCRACIIRKTTPLPLLTSFFAHRGDPRGPRGDGRHDHGRRERVPPPRGVAAGDRHGANGVPRHTPRDGDRDIREGAALRLGEGLHAVLAAIGGGTGERGVA